VLAATLLAYALFLLLASLRRDAPRLDEDEPRLLPPLALDSSTPDTTPDARPSRRRPSGDASVRVRRRSLVGLDASHVQSLLTSRAGDGASGSSTMRARMSRSHLEVLDEVRPLADGHAEDGWPQFDRRQRSQSHE